MEGECIVPRQLPMESKVTNIMSTQYKPFGFSSSCSSFETDIAFTGLFDSAVFRGLGLSASSHLEISKGFIKKRSIISSLYFSY